MNSKFITGQWVWSSIYQAPALRLFVRKKLKETKCEVVGDKLKEQPARPGNPRNTNRLLSLHYHTYIIYYVSVDYSTCQYCRKVCKLI